MTISRSSAVLAFALISGACSNKPSDPDWICNQPPGLVSTAAVTSDEQISVAEGCLHKWSYRLGKAPGSNGEIAKAAVGACREAVDRVLELKIAESEAAKKPFTDDQWQLLVRRFDENALFRVAQGRAGGCSIGNEDQL
jgi:hypothetical protein